MKGKQNIRIAIAKRELASWFSSPVAYIVACVFLIFSGFLFFSTFFLVDRAELRGFFAILPVLFAFFIPAITMRLFSEETRSGSVETLMTMPVSGFDATIGKYIAGLVSSASILVPTLSYAVTAAILGEIEWGPIAGGYLGAIFLAAAFTSIGLFASALTNNQIIAFFAAFTFSIFLAMIDRFLVIFPAAIVAPLEYLSAGYHFDSVSRGILDSRDIVYFASITALFLALTVRAVEVRRSPK
jgi:ABC-2 type transport system permease protein